MILFADALFANSEFKGKLTKDTHEPGISNKVLMNMPTNVNGNLGWVHNALTHLGKDIFLPPLEFASRMVVGEKYFSQDKLEHYVPNQGFCLLIH